LSRFLYPEASLSNINYDKYWEVRIQNENMYKMPRHYKIVNEIMSRSNSGKILDLGCGEAHVLNMLPNDYEKYGCDISKVIYRFIDNNNFLFSITDLNNDFPFRDVKFDFIVCSEVLEHLRNPFNVLKNVKYNLKKDGYFIVTIPNHYNLKYKIELFLKKYPTWDKTHVNCWKINDFLNVLIYYGFNVINYYPTYSYKIPINFLINYKSLYQLFGQQLLFICKLQKKGD